MCNQLEFHYCLLIRIPTFQLITRFGIVSAIVLRVIFSFLRVFVFGCSMKPKSLFAYFATHTEIAAFFFLCRLVYLFKIGVR